jgi:glycosyltransferase involved in cell wall biosynthesis
MRREEYRKVKLPDSDANTSSMRIAFLGNQGNNSYRYCKWMRQRGHDAHLYLFPKENPARSLPELLDAELIDNYPDWIRQFDDGGIFRFFNRAAAPRMIDRQYDVVITSGATGLMAAGRFSLPVVHITLGSEVSQFPLWIWKLKLSIRWRLACFLMRRNLKRVRKIVTMGFWPELRTLESLGYADKTVVWGFPEDCRDNLNRVNRKQLDELTARYADCEKVFIWLGRLNFLDTASVEYKAAEKFLDAFEMLVRDGRKVKAIVGAHGYDVEAFRKRVTQKGLDSSIDYVGHIPVHEMLTYMSLPNCVSMDAPDLERGHVFGGVVREAMSVGSPVIAGMDIDSVTRSYGPGCPILTAFDVQSCHEAMTAVTDMDDGEFAQLRNATERWARSYVHYDQRMDMLSEILADVVGRW